MAKKTKEEWKTYKNVFDEFTRRNLFILQSQGFFEDLKSPIKIGKESNVFSATTKEGKLIAVKIYRLENCNFNQMFRYIKTDPRYVNMKKTSRSVIFSWVQREYRNLLKARTFGVNCPKPIALKYNIILMEYIGDHKNNHPSPQLKDAIPKNKTKFLDKIIDNMKKLHKAKLVHGDLSKFNILNEDETPIFIDFSQSSDIKCSIFNELLTRDCLNIADFFTKSGLKTTKENIYKKILASKENK